jgi:hypothetical protein
LTRASIHFRKKMDCRVKPGNDRDRFNLNGKCSKYQRLTEIAPAELSFQLRLKSRREFNP